MKFLLVPLILPFLVLVNGQSIEQLLAEAKESNNVESLLAQTVVQDDTSNISDEQVPFLIVESPELPNILETSRTSLRPKSTTTPSPRILETRKKLFKPRVRNNILTRSRLNTNNNNNKESPKSTTEKIITTPPAILKKVINTEEKSEIKNSAVFSVENNNNKKSNVPRSRVSLFSSPRSRFRPRPRSEPKKNEVAEATAKKTPIASPTASSSTEPSRASQRTVTNLLRRVRPSLRLRRPQTTASTTASTTIVTDAPTTSTTTITTTTTTITTTTTTTTTTTATTTTTITTAAPTTTQRTTKRLRTTTTESPDDFTLQNVFAAPTPASFSDLVRLVPGRVSNNNDNKPTEPTKSNEIPSAPRIRIRPQPKQQQNQQRQQQQLLNQQQLVKKIGKIAEDDDEKDLPIIESPRSRGQQQQFGTKQQQFEFPASTFPLLAPNNNNNNRRIKNINKPVNPINSNNNQQQRSRRPRPRPTPRTLIESIPVVENVHPSIPTVVTNVFNDFEPVRRQQQQQQQQQPLLPARRQPVQLVQIPKDIVIPNSPPAPRPVRPKPAPAAEQPRQQQPTRPRPSNRANFPKNFKVVKPTKQNNINSNRRISVVDRYTVQNDDGSFTWGYQSEDGSFKEETMGIDCVTRGRYGYVDPTGNIREFTYKSGIPCDPETKESLTPDPTEKPQRNKKGYFDYNDNKFVLPSGKRVTVVVNKANRARG